MSSANMLVVTAALVKEEGGLALHPELSAWKKALLKREYSWFQSQVHNPLSFVASFTSSPPAALLAAQASGLDGCTQCWVASPYHARLVRDRVHMLPEGMLPWYEEDAAWMMETVNPLLAEDKMKLISVGSSLLLACHEKLDVRTPSFAEVMASGMPNRHPEGGDGGRIMRLHAEIQMLLSQQPNSRRRQAGEPEVNGLWFWGRCDLPLGEAVTLPAIATRAYGLHSVVDAQQSSITVTEVERLAELVQMDRKLPDHVVLTGEGYALWLRSSWRGFMSRVSWYPAYPESESTLMHRLRLR